MSDEKFLLTGPIFLGLATLCATPQAFLLLESYWNFVKIGLNLNNEVEL